MPNLAVRKHIPTKALHELMDSDIDLALSAVDHLDRIDIRIELFPLAAPIGANPSFPDYTPAFGCLGPAHVLTHERQCTVDVPLVESRVDLSYECLRVCHEALHLDEHSDCMTMISP